jgi:hypothetical protein
MVTGLVWRGLIELFNTEVVVMRGKIIVNEGCRPLTNEAGKWTVREAANPHQQFPPHTTTHSNIPLAETHFPNIFRQ